MRVNQSLKIVKNHEALLPRFNLAFPHYKTSWSIDMGIDAVRQQRPANCEILFN